MLDYHDCMKFLEQKYNFKSRNYYNNLDNYKDFWHYIIEDDGISNGSFFSLWDGQFEDMDEDDFRKIIWGYIEKEFAEHIDEEGFIEFWVEW